MKKDWAEILKSYEERDCTLAEFAKARGVSSAALSYNLTQKNKLQNKFISVSKEPETKSSSVVIEFPSGIKLRVQG